MLKGAPYAAPADIPNADKHCHARESGHLGMDSRLRGNDTG